MRRARPRDNVRGPAVLICHQPNVDEGAVCAPGYTGRKRGEVVRTRTTALQMHTRQWVGTYAGKGNGDYQGELARALRGITAYLKHFGLPAEMALVRLDGAGLPDRLSALCEARAVRSHHRWSWQDRLACNAWSGPPKPRITGAGVPTFLASN